MFLSSSELQQLKKEQTDLMKRERLVKREARTDESIQNKLKKRYQQGHLELIEEELRKRPNKKITRIGSFGESSSSSGGYLNEIKDLHERAKDLIKHPYKLNEIKEEPEVAERKLHFRLKKVPVEKETKVEKQPTPPMYQKTLKNGDVMTVHLLSEQPSFKVKSKREENKGKSLSPKLRRILKIDDPFVMPRSNDTEDEEVLENSHFRAVAHSFRELTPSTNSRSEKRTWVNQRMRQYASTIRKSYKPVTSARKSLEMELQKEKFLVHKKPLIKRMKLVSL